MTGMNTILKTIVVVFLICVFSDSGYGQRFVDASRFQAPKQREYTLDKGDTLGVFVEGVVGEVNGMPPVTMPTAGSSLPPAIGFPTLVLHDATIRLPFHEPFSVRGMTVPQVEAMLKKAYLSGDEPIITERSRVIVSLIRKRTVNVVVVRGDQSQARSGSQGGRNNTNPVSARSDQSGNIFSLNLPADESDILTAMIESGGLPGVNAQDNLQVLRNIPSLSESRNRNQSFTRSGTSAQRRTNSTSFPRSGQSSQRSSSSTSFPRTGASAQRRTSSTSIPLRGNGASSFPRSNARLNDGDVLTISSKPTELYYTGGLLGGGEFVIPRDRPLSVSEAIAQAGGIPPAQRGVGAIPLQQPRMLTLLRNQGGRQVAYQFDFSNGFSQRASQTQVRSGDFLILNFSRAQQVQNIGVGVFNTFGIRQLLR